MSESIADLKGKTLAAITVNDDKEQVLFRTEDGDVFRMLHYQDCCESVSLEEVIGDLADLIGSPILEADEATNETDPPPSGRGNDANLWTFYKLRTIKGGVTLRWFGSSNGYYSVGVNFAKVH